MSDTSAIAILASVGILLAGTVSAEATALASAIQQGDPTALTQFVQQYPESQLVPDALLIAYDVTQNKTEDSAKSADNAALTCSLTIKRQPDGKAVVRWNITGASAISLHPLGFKKGQRIPLSGEKTVDADNFLRVGLVVKDASGHEISCSVVLNTTEFENNPFGAFTVSPTVPSSLSA